MMQGELVQATREVYFFNYKTDIDIKVIQIVETIRNSLFNMAVLPFSHKAPEDVETIKNEIQ